MTVNHQRGAAHGPSALERIGRKRWVPFAAGVTAAALTAAAVATAGGGTAGAATAPKAQSAGNFLDATIGGNPIDQIAKLAFARAQNPGNVTDQNPLDVTLLNAINLPLTGALNLPQLLGIDLGAANQVALAKSDGQARGAAGAVLNSGGVSVGGDGGASPANATINLTASGLAGNSPVPIPGGTGSADALGGVKAEIGAVSSIARVPKYGPALASSWLATCTQADATCYDIASLKLSLGSPLLGGLLSHVLGTVSTTLGTLITQLTSGIGGVVPLPANCKLVSPTAITQPISLDNGAVVLDPTNGSLTIDLQKLLQTLGLNLNDLPANTDLLAKVLNYLTSPTGLAKGLEDVINGLTAPLTSQYTACKSALQAIPLLGPVLVSLLNTLTSSQTTLETAINNLVSSLSGAGGANPLAPIGTLLSKLLDIGVNVQPQVSSGDFNTNLDSNPKQGMTAPPVPYQHTVRAIEVQLLGTSGVTVALANSAAGPSNPTVAPTPTPTASGPSVPPTSIPTGVPAGEGTHGGSPTLPLVLLALGLMFAGGGVVAYRMRATLNQH
jgi:hypothetical protein